MLDLTANPDFSQVESDEPQTTVNKRFEVFFPEKRPFFTENASYFETPLPVLFTRRIRDPNLGARLTGKVGRYAIGALVTDDIPAADSSKPPRDSESRAVSSVFRISRDIGTESAGTDICRTQGIRARNPRGRNRWPLADQSKLVGRRADACQR